jgi:hypothetical protein
MSPNTRLPALITISSARSRERGASKGVSVAPVERAPPSRVQSCSEVRQRAPLRSHQRHAPILDGGQLGKPARRHGSQERRRRRTTTRDTDPPTASPRPVRRRGGVQPIHPGVESGIGSEKRLRDYRRLVDAATEEGINQDWADRKGLRATPKPYGCGRYIRLHGRNVVCSASIQNCSRLPARLPFGPLVGNDSPMNKTRAENSVTRTETGTACMTVTGFQSI